MSIDQLFDAVSDALDSDSNDYQDLILKIYFNTFQKYKSISKSNKSELKNLTQFVNHVIIILRLLPIKLKLAMTKLSFEKVLCNFLTIYLDLNTILKEDLVENLFVNENKLLKKIFSILGEKSSYIWSILFDSVLIKKPSLLGPVLSYSLNQTQNVNHDYYQYIQMIWILYFFSLSTQNHDLNNEIQKLSSLIFVPIGLSNWLVHHFSNLKLSNDNEAKKILLDHSQPSELFQSIHKKITSDDLEKYSDLNISNDQNFYNSLAKKSKISDSILSYSDANDELNSCFQNFTNDKICQTLDEVELSNLPYALLTNNQNGFLNSQSDIDSFHFNQATQVIESDVEEQEYEKFNNKKNNRSLCSKNTDRNKAQYLMSQEDKEENQKEREGEANVVEEDDEEKEEEKEKEKEEKEKEKEKAKKTKLVQEQEEKVKEKKVEKKKKKEKEGEEKNKIEDKKIEAEELKLGANDKQKQNNLKNNKVNENILTYKDAIDEFEKQKMIKGVPFVELDDIRHLLPTSLNYGLFGDQLYLTKVKASEQSYKKKRRYKLQKKFCF